jgi:hypothetical protein
VTPDGWAPRTGWPRTGGLGRVAPDEVGSDGVAADEVRSDGGDPGRVGAPDGVAPDGRRLEAAAGTVGGAVGGDREILL